jgi:hypothetical protein
VAAEVFRPQGVGRAVRTAFVLGVLIVIAIVASVGAFHQFNSLVGNNSKDELSRYLDDNAHTAAPPKSVGFQVDFPVPPARQAEKVSVGVGSLTVARDRALVDDEITFDAVWFDLPGSAPADPTRLLSTLINLQIHQAGGVKQSVGKQERIDRASSRDIVYRTVETTGAKRYFDERIIVQGRRVWLLRVGSHIPRYEAFRQFAASFTFTK